MRRAHYLNATKKNLQCGGSVPSGPAIALGREAVGIIAAVRRVHAGLAVLDAQHRGCRGIGSPTAIAHISEPQHAPASSQSVPRARPAGRHCRAESPESPESPESASTASLASSECSASTADSSRTSGVAASVEAEGDGVSVLSSAQPPYATTHAPASATQSRTRRTRIRSTVAHPLEIGCSGASLCRSRMGHALGQTPDLVLGQPGLEPAPADLAGAVWISSVAFPGGLNRPQRTGTARSRHRLWQPGGNARRSSVC